MVSLLWKEARERSLWAVALVVISAYAACTRGYTFYGSPGPEMVSWSMGPVLMALLMGASSYTSELTSKRRIFLFTRPVTWKGVIVAKLTVSAVVLLGAAAIAALVYRCTCPAAYAQCLTSQKLLDGACWAAIFTSAAFLVGLTCSSVLSGTAESAVFAVVQGLVLVYFLGLPGTRSGGLWRQIMAVLWPVSLLAAGAVVARFGLTLPSTERFRRYAIAAPVCLALLACMVYVIPDPFLSRPISSRLSYESIDWSISPDGLYALGRDMSSLYWLDVRKDKLTRLEYIFEDYSGMRVALEDVVWVGCHTVCRIGYGRNAWHIRTYGPHAAKARRRDILMGELSDRCGYPNEIRSSPGGRFVAVSLSFGVDKPQNVVFAEIATGRKLSSMAGRAVGASMWWESSSVFCVTGPRGKTLRVSMPI